MGEVLFNSHGQAHPQQRGGYTFASFKDGQLSNGMSKSQYAIQQVLQFEQ